VKLSERDVVPEVSVVMPAYNAQRYIAATLQSVLDQTYRRFELLVVDDCSTDATREVVAGFSERDARVRLIRLPRNRGAPAGPRNVGVAEARGKWVAFLDADDIWHPQKLEIQLAVLERTGAKFCSSRMVDFEDESQLRFTPVTQPALERIGFFKQLVKFRTPTSSVVLSRDLIRRHSFNEDPTFKAREDLDCWLRCHEEIRSSIKVSHPLIGYRVIAGQISGRKWQMVQRHHHVLRQYRFQSGRSMGAGAAVFTASHFLLALYYRVLKKEL
jgi:teichuronic acid biosynthesis glycosyltransferase TuaG